jgi:hypothetical protein
VDLYIHSPIRLHGVVHNYISTGTTFFFTVLRSRVGAVGIATGWTAGGRFPAGARELSILYGVQTVFGFHPASYPTEPEVLSLGVKQPRRQAHRSPPSSTGVKNGGSIPLLPYTSSWLGMTEAYHRPDTSPERYCYANLGGTHVCCLHLVLPKRR